MITTICVFSGSSFGNNPAYKETAEMLGRVLAQRDLRLVYGGAAVGLMGAIADACLQGNGKVIGIMPRALVDKEIAHRGLTELRVVETMHQRKALMASLSDAFIALPGGYGTWEEFFEVLTWSQLSLHRKACALLNVDGYYDPLLSMADRAVVDGLLRSTNRDLLLTDTDPERLLDRLETYIPPIADKWIAPTLL